MSSQIDLTKPRYDQSTYLGRAKHFFQLTNPVNIFASDSQLDEAKQIITEFKYVPTFNKKKLYPTE